MISIVIFIFIDKYSHTQKKQNKTNKKKGKTGRSKI